MTKAPFTTLQAGQTIGIFAPSSSIVSERFERGVNYLHHHGYKTLIHPQTYMGADSGHQQSGSAQDKVTAFIDLWNNPAVDAIFAACGGNGAAHMLPHIEWSRLQSPPKLIMGFSDTSALLSALYANKIASPVFGPTVQTLPRLTEPASVLACLSGHSPFTLPLSGSSILRNGMSEGPVFAATLSVLCSLIGTKFFPSLQGHILIIEDIGEELSRLDRMLWQLNQIINFSSLNGLIIGECIDTKDTGRPFGLTWEKIIQNHTTQMTAPVIMKAPIGHGASLPAIPLGHKAQINTAADCLIFA